MYCYYLLLQFARIMLVIPSVDNLQQRGDCEVPDNHDSLRDVCFASCTQCGTAGEYIILCAIIFSSNVSCEKAYCNSLLVMKKSVC